MMQVFFYFSPMTPSQDRQESFEQNPVHSSTVYNRAAGDDPMKDNGGRALPLHIAFRTNSIHEAATAAISKGTSVMMIGALTSATNNFGVNYSRHSNDSLHLVGIQAATLAPDKNGDFPFTSVDYRNDDEAALRDVDRQHVLSNEIRLNQDREGEERHTITIGAGITFSQVNHVLKEAFGDNEHYDYYVPIDLTTTDIAHAGAVYATGAQGPSRFRVSDVARSITITDGTKRIKLTDPKDIEAHQGLWGMTGGVVEMELNVFRRPKHRFGFFIPLRSNNNDGWTLQTSAVLSLLKDATALSLSDGEIRSGWNNGLVDGVEVFSRDCLELVANTPLPSGSNRIAAKKILDLMGSREKNGGKQLHSDLGIYITGNSRFSEIDGFLDDADSPLSQLVSYSESKEQFLYADGIHTIVDNPSKLEEMRLLRESFADIARQDAKRQEKGQTKPFSESTDINCFIDPEIAAQMSPDELRVAYRRILQPYFSYENHIHDLKTLAKPNGIDITMSRYGHLNPRSLNPHTRVTIHAPEDSINTQIYQQVVLRARENLLRILMETSVAHPEIRVEGGEKGKMTNEAFDIMNTQQRMAVAEVLAEANPQFQPHLKGVWAKLVQEARTTRDVPLEASVTADPPAARPYQIAHP